MADEEQKNSSFKVNDRRRFDSEGEAREQATPEDVPENSASTSEVKSQPSAGSEPINSEAPRDFNQQQLPADFSYLILSLATSAQSALGLVPHPLSQKVEKNLLQAKHAIDLLEVLAQKTQGNLNPEEAELLEAILYQLRMQFVEAKKEA